MSVSTKVAISKASSHKKYRNFFFVLLLISFFIALLVPFTNFPSDVSKKFEGIDFRDLKNLPSVKLTNSASAVAQKNPLCTHWDCFNIYRCGHTGHDRISVYVYPLRKYFDEDGVHATGHLSREYFSLLNSVINSKYYTSNPDEACIFVPSIDTLNQDKIQLNLTSKALSSLSHWRNGENHIIFNMVAGSSPDFLSAIELDIGNAMIAGAGFDTYTFRENFDVSLPVFSPAAELAEVKDISHERTWLVISSQLTIDPYFLSELQKLKQRHQEYLLILDTCHAHEYTQRCDIDTDKKYSYPSILRQSIFCLVFRGERMGQFVLLEAMAANCLPVIVMDGHVMPFSTIIDWKHFAVFVSENHLSTLMDVLNGISAKRIRQMQRTLLHVYKEYLSSMEKITLTTLDILQDRVYRHLGKTYDMVNLLPQEIDLNPLFFPITSPKAHGFTAVILTYDRVESLFKLVERLSKVPSLMKIVVVWNHQKKHPPPLSAFPKIPKPINIIKTKANKLSNRFYPYKEIETEAVLHIDDDIVMLTSDEVEFAYEVWREFPDRIVGFPSRTHIWDNATQKWKYESEWTNEISMVLTGAAFLHKYWSFLYTNFLPRDVKDWADEQMNCEDIAMNFLVANITKKPPIKVTPRKKFKCPECTSNEMLSADMGHMVARSQCVDRFTKAFGWMPLKTVEFRADPVLFKDPFPEKLKRFNDIGSL